MDLNQRYIHRSYFFMLIKFVILINKKKFSFLLIKIKFKLIFFFKKKEMVAGSKLLN